MKIRMRFLAVATLVTIGCWCFGGCVSYSSGGPDAGDDVEGIFDADGADDGGGVDGDGVAPDGDGGGGDDGGGVDGDCVVAEPLTVRLQIGEDPWGCPDCYGETAGPAQVLLKRRSDEHQTSEVWLLFRDERFVAKTFANLPEGREIPVKVGERFWGRTVVDAPWWISQSMELREGGPDGNLRFLQLDFDFNFPGIEARCPPVEDGWGCGEVIHPQVTFRPHPDLSEVSLEQGGSAWIGGQGLGYHVFVGDLHQYLTMECDDVPMGWMQSAVLETTRVSQCRCAAQTDCARGFVCDDHAHACVPDLCPGISCTAGEACDPYTGRCVPVPEGVQCTSHADCGDARVCNRFTGRCLDDFCQIVDCAPCSALLGRCYECLHNCDCWPAVCDPQTETCRPGCARDKIDFTRGNPESFELFFVCIEDVLDDPSDLLSQFLDGVQCGGSGPQGVCDLASEVFCAGAVEYEGPDSRAVSHQQWTGLCAVTRLPVVGRIAGGYYLP